MNVALAGGACSAAPAQDRSLAEAYRIIASKQFVDLTHSFSPLTPVWKGFGPATLSRAADPETGRPYEPTGHSHARPNAPDHRGPLAPCIVKTLLALHALLKCRASK